jgi:MFS family permease
MGCRTHALTLAALLLTGGSLGDLRGRRKVFAGGVFVFATASAWCGLCRTIGELIAARTLQGVGAALLVPGSLSLISASFPAAERGRATGTWSGFTAITAALGPVLGGWLVQHLSWRWVFFINLPIALAILAITIWRVPETRAAHVPDRLDWPGIVLTTAGLGAVVFALIESVPVAGLAGIILLIGFLVLSNSARRLRCFRWPCSARAASAGPTCSRFSFEFTPAGLAGRQWSHPSTGGVGADRAASYDAADRAAHRADDRDNGQDHDWQKKQFSEPARHLELPELRGIISDCAEEECQRQRDRESVPHQV